MILIVLFLPTMAQATDVSNIELLEEDELFTGGEYGLAVQYLNDEGIKDHPSVIFASRFETSDWLREDFGLNMQEIKPDLGYHTADPSLAFTGQGALEYQTRAGLHVPYVYDIPFEGQDVVYLRWYRRYEAGFDFSCVTKTNGVYAHDPELDTSSSSGTRPTGYDKFSTKLTMWKQSGTDMFEPKFYTYHPEQVDIYGDLLAQNVGETQWLEAGRWYSFEIMLKANEVGQHNGEIKLWIDGVLQGYYTGMHFRDTNELKINELNITAYVGGGCASPRDQRIWDDNLVLATEYIGPAVSTEVLLLDNTDAGFSYQGVWQEYSDGNGEHYGYTHYYKEEAGAGTDTATWTFTVPEPGNYAVYAWWWGGEWRPVDVPYTIHHQQGSTIVRVDQRVNGGRWNLLGNFDFQDQGSVVVSDDVSSGRGIVADAIRLVHHPHKIHLPLAYR